MEDLKMKKLKKTILRIMPIFFMYATKVNAADVVSEVQGGGSIQSSKLGQGLLNIVRDITGTMQWILPITGVCFILFYVFKIMTGDEQDQQRYKKSIIKVLVCIVIGLLAVTIVNLISRFYNLNGGRLLIDGIDISDVTLKSLRSQMGIMLQDSVIFSGSIRDNIRYGRLDATNEEIEAACKVVGADEFINEMPDGYDTFVKERGSSLSQGQRQMIAFARTILADPKILVLDEATSSIDAKTERYIQHGIDHLLKGRTSFIIAHRLSTIKSCDKIMYISDKGIAESGTHDELMAKKGLYYKLCMAQAI
ncbi:MAG: ATP-binding cassette domain-containing protein [Ruminococcus sp.]|nr:ATP-binding cassette domain-containing protein [Ruminococcus sp.]